jgi:hypothetical protein
MKSLVFVLVSILAGCASAANNAVQVNSTNAVLTSPPGFFESNNVARLSAVNASNAVQDALIGSKASTNTTDALAVTNTAQDAVIALRATITALAATSTADRAYTDLAGSNAAVNLNTASNTLAASVASNAVTDQAYAAAQASNAVVNANTNAIHALSVTNITSASAGVTITRPSAHVVNVEVTQGDSSNSVSAATVTGIVEALAYPLSENPSNYQDSVGVSNIVITMTNLFGGGGGTFVVITTTTNISASTNGATLIISEMMDSNSPSPYVAYYEGAGLETANYSAWKAFDRTIGEGGAALINPPNGSAVVVDAGTTNATFGIWQINNLTSGGVFPTNFSVEGSINGSDWTVIDSKTNYPSPWTGDSPLFAVPSTNIIPSRFIRLVFRSDSSDGGAGTTIVDEFRMWTTNGAVVTNFTYTTNSYSTLDVMGGYLSTNSPDGVTIIYNTNGTISAVAAGVTWGAVTGTLTNQTDLNDALLGKQPTGDYATVTALGGYVATGAVGTAAYSNANAFATSNQGALADTALQAESDTLQDVIGRSPEVTSAAIWPINNFGIWSTNKILFLGGYASIRKDKAQIIINNGGTIPAYGIESNKIVIASGTSDNNAIEFRNGYSNTVLVISNNSLYGSGSSLTGITASQVGASPTNHTQDWSTITNAPTIPTNNTQLVNGMGYLTNVTAAAIVDAGAVTGTPWNVALASSNLLGCMVGPTCSIPYNVSAPASDQQFYLIPTNAPTIILPTGQTDRANALVLTLYTTNQVTWDSGTIQTNDTSMYSASATNICVFTKAWGRPKWIGWSRAN